MGALEFMPAKDDYLDESSAIEISSLVQIAAEVLSDKADLKTNLKEDTKEALINIIKVSTSAGGQRAKAVIAYNDTTGEVRSGQLEAAEGFNHWLLKLDGVTNAALGDPQHYGKIEYAYYKMALKAGIEMTECRLLEENGRSHFMT
jgi:serine/threonine-protein kinase HipA